VVAAVCGLWLNWGHSVVVAVAAAIAIVAIASWVAQDNRRKERS